MGVFGHSPEPISNPALQAVNVIDRPDLQAVKVIDRDNALTIDANGQQIIQIGGVGATSDKSGVDEITNVLTSIDYSHHEIHEGNMFSITHYNADLDNGDVMSLSFLTPNSTKWFHLFVQANNSSASLFSLLEASTVTAGTGTDTNIHNRNRNSLNVSGAYSTKDGSGCKVTLDGSITDDGTLLRAATIGAGKDKGASEIRGTNEWILKPSTVYSMRIAGLADNGNASIEAIWYEHRNKN